MGSMCAITLYLSNGFEGDDIINLNTILWVVGRALSDPREHCGLLLMYGPGGNGKSTLNTVVQLAMGDSSCASMDSSFMGKPNATINANTIANLFEARIVSGGDMDF